MHINQARELICPFLQVSGAGYSFEGNKGTNHTLCLTRDCMAWRFAYESSTHGYCVKLKDN